MNKTTNFSGAPIIKQILKYILPTDISRTAEKYKSDRYYKRFKTYDHLVTMIYAILSGVSSLRELSTVMLACEGRISHLNLKHFPKRSSLSDANKKRSREVFGAIYSILYKRYAGFLSDSNVMDYFLFAQNSNHSPGAKQPTCKVAFRKAALDLTGFSTPPFPPCQSPKFLQNLKH